MKCGVSGSSVIDAVYGVYRHMRVNNITELEFKSMTVSVVGSELCMESPSGIYSIDIGKLMYLHNGIHMDEQSDNLIIGLKYFLKFGGTKK